MCIRDRHRSAPSPLVAPLYQSLTFLLEKGDLVVENGWLLSSETALAVDQLPQWMGQITLKGVEVERVLELSIRH